MFDYGGVSAATAESIRELQQRVHRMQGSGLARPLPVLDPLAPLVTLQTGSAYAVDSLSLVLALLAGPSAAGEWSAVVGLPDLGWEAAQGFGVDLTRTVAVPEPGEHWLSVTAGLLDVTTVVAVRPPAAVTEHQAARIVARLRQRDACLIVYGRWPRAASRLGMSAPSWEGLGSGHGHLRRRTVTVTATTGTAPPRRAELWLPTTDATVAAAVRPTPSLSSVRAS
jgi:hypothetical protein